MRSPAKAEFRVKEMTLAERLRFQDAFGGLCMHIEAEKRPARFLRLSAEATRSTILIGREEASSVEAISPGAWRDHRTARKGGWILIAGHSRSRSDPANELQRAVPDLVLNFILDEVH